MGKGKEKCPVCGNFEVLRTLNSRPLHDRNIMRIRRIVCTGCNSSFTTHEIFYDPTDEAKPRNVAAAFLGDLHSLMEVHFGDDKRQDIQSKPGVATESQLGSLDE